MSEDPNKTETFKIQKLRQKKLERFKINYNEDWFINAEEC